MYEMPNACYVIIEKTMLECLMKVKLITWIYIYNTSNMGNRFPSGSIA